MGKSPAPKAASANAKKLGVAKSKASSVGKKAMKKRLEIDLEQPKDRDPVNSSDVDIKQIDDAQDALQMADEFEARRIAERDARHREEYNKLVPKLSELWSKKLYSVEVVNQALQRMDSIQTGNALFAAWDDRYPGAWNQPCLRFDALFNDYEGTSTCNDRFLQIFTYLNSDNAQLAQYLISSFDLFTIEDKAAEDVWSMRVLAMRISLQNPFSFFGIDKFEKNQNNNQFFDGDKSDPRLRLENPLVGFWLICSELFDYPWATTFGDNYYNEPPSSIIRGIKQKRLAPSQSFFRPESSTHHTQQAIQKISDPMNDHLDNAVGQSHLNKTTLVDQRKRHRNLTDNRYDALVDDDGSSGENADNAEAADDDATTIDGDAYQQPNQDDDDDEILVTEVQNNPRRPPLSSDDEDDGDEDDDDNADDDAVSNGGVVQTESVEAPKAIKRGKPPKQPAKKARTSTGVQFQEPSSAQTLAAPAVQVDTSHTEGDNTTAASQDESQTSSLTASTSRGGGPPFFSPPPGKAQSDGARDWSGDDHRRRSPLATRICFQNVNGLPENGNDPKQQQINSWLKEERVGIALLAEAKTFWPSINEGHGWSDRLCQATMKSKQKGFYSSVAYNWHQDRSAATSSVQWGGCITTVLNQVAHRAKEAGRDPTGLGRWAYVCLQGRKLKANGGNVQDSLVELNDAVRRPISKDLVVVSAYRPNKQGLGGSTVWAQHRLHFHAVNRKANPRKAFVDDLCKQITKWRDEGCEVVLGIDANEDVTVNAPQSIRHRFRACGLEEAILNTTHRRKRPISATNRTFQSMASSLLWAYQSSRVGTTPLMNSLIVITADCGLTLIFPSPWATSNLRSPTSSHASCPFKTLDPYANIFNWFTKVMPGTPSRRD
ncbi:unnamed protein product [Cylindrotheca closterium]|uniref:Uncharacterized protein n=1 Tax=Cylindrotheca closterium TaxID=2856 RepID=A0AAD2G321_9STRA|nr:unnamed protein product [Cylindrotheca closterium]